MRGLFDLSTLKRVKEYRNVQGSVALYQAPNEMYYVFEDDGSSFLGCRKFDSANLIFEREAKKLRGKM